MKEIEIKILDINPEKIRKKLLELGAEKVFDGEVHVISFDLPDERLNKAGQHLRVRKVGKQVELCLKCKNPFFQHKRTSGKIFSLFICSV